MDVDNPVTSGKPFPEHGWRRAEFCGPNGGNCVEVNLVARGVVVGVRDSKVGGGPVLTFSGGQWRSFLAAMTSARLRQR
ncbi:DUF397 domain-containing protein [Actinophytocola sp.]|uniref:DUF397 domain-containing protein n=1 Tax=Actinophytocola sp. TaxID=1872138 RepID=UPI00389A707C